jgi:hypothetical protein
MAFITPALRSPDYAMRPDVACKASDLRAKADAESGT